MKGSLLLLLFNSPELTGRRDIPVCALQCDVPHDKTHSRSAIFNGIPQEMRHFSPLQADPVDIDYL